MEANRSFERLVHELGYLEAGGLVRAGEFPEDGMRAAALERVRRHLPDIDAIYFSGDVPVAYFSINSQVQDQATRARIHRWSWNDSRVPLLFIVDSAHVRVYDAWARPTLDEAEIDADERLIYQLSVTGDFLAAFSDFHRIRLDTGTYAQALPNRFSQETRCEASLLANLEATRTRLANLGDLPEEVIHHILLRSILILHLESRGILRLSLYDRFFPGARKFTDLLRNRSATYGFFAELARRFNGDLLPIEAHESAVQAHHLDLLRRCLEGVEDIGRGQLTLWPLYDFKVIPIQLISSVYEWMLHSADPAGAREEGAFYTPYPLVELMLNEVLPWPAPGEPVVSIPRVIDPSCGSGVFLVEAYRRLIAYWRARHPGTSPSAEDLSNLLRQHLRGIDKNHVAVRVAAFSLYLTILDELADAQIAEGMRFPRLTSGAGKGKGSILLIGDAFERAPSLLGEFDLVVGNPPWRRKSLPESVQTWCRERDYPVAGEIAQAFLWLARDLAPRGRGALLAPAKWLFNRERLDVDFRESFFRLTEVESVTNLSALVGGEGRLFSANAPAAVVVFKAVRPDLPSPSILYCAPRPDPRRGVPALLRIDTADVKWLPRDEAEISSDVWKVLYFGSWRDFRLVRRLRNQGRNLQSLITSRGWINGRGFQPGEGTPEPRLREIPFVSARSVDRYVLRRLPDASWPGESFKWTGPLQIYDGPHVLLKEGLSEFRLCAAFVPDDCSFRDTITGIHGPEEDSGLLKALVVYLNSALAGYQLLLTSGWGIDRYRVKKSEVLDLLPAEILQDYKIVSHLERLFDEYQDAWTGRSRKDIEGEMDEVVFRAFGLSEGELVLVEDLRETVLDRTGKGVSSGPAERPGIDRLRAYAEAFRETFGQILSPGGKGLSATVYSGDSPLQAVSFQIEEEPQIDLAVRGNEDLCNLLHDLDRMLWSREGINVYRRRHLRVFEDAAVHIVKPAERCFWTRSAAFHDADEVLAQTLVAEDVAS